MQIKLVEQNTLWLSFNEVQALNDYLKWIVRQNQEQTNSHQLYHFLPAYGFGWLEELREYFWVEDSYTYSGKDVLELGDVLAYTCLLVGSWLLKQPQTDLSQEFVLDVGKYATANHDFTLEFAGAMKRVTRGDDKEDYHRKAAEVALAHFLELYNLNPYTLQSIVEKNKQKLTARLANTGTYKGSGDR
jgi:hypothetical protein